MSDFMQDPMFFYSIALVIFLGIAYRYARKPLLGWLDGEILKIKAELDQARKLRAEAEATLAEYKIKQTVAMSEAEAIVRHAKEEALRLRARAESDLKAALERHEQQAMERIRLAEAEAMAAVRTAAIDTAMTMARSALSSQLDEATSARLTDQAITEIAKAKTAKEKAA
jgi:F-type H+-transporting ATPase subunit b